MTALAKAAALRARKAALGQRPIAVLTAYDYPTALILEGCRRLDDKPAPSAPR